MNFSSDRSYRKRHRTSFKVSSCQYNVINSKYNNEYYYYRFGKIDNISGNGANIASSSVRYIDIASSLMKLMCVFKRYIDLHERLTKTTELQTSALSALWKKV